MSEELKNQVELRKYLLGLLEEAQTKEIEESLVLDEECFQELQIVEAEIIQDLVDEKLSSEEKKAFDENFIITEERREQINFARALRKFVDEKPTTQSEEKPSFFDLLKSFSLSPIPAFGAVLVVVGISAFVWWNFSQKSEVLVALNKSQKNERPTDARISDFDYAPKTEGTRGNNNTENLDLVFAKSRATEAVLKNPTAENYHELGRVYLAEKNFDESIKQFEKAVKLNPNISKLNNDLGVALMEKGRLKTEGKLELFARANESIEKAIERDKSLKEAYFNRALAIELLNLPNQAKEAWENYLKLDSTSKWADEARQRLKKLEANKPISKTKEEVLQDFLEAKKANDTEKAWQTLSKNRDLGSGKLIPQQLAFLFVKIKSNGEESKAKEVLDALKYAAKLEEEKGGDFLWNELAKHYSRITDDKIAPTKNAQELMNEAAKLRIKGDIESALNSFETAKQIFIENNNAVEEKLCDNWIATITFQLGKLEESNKTFNSLAKLSEEHNFKWLATQSYVRLSYGFISKNKHSKSIESNLNALRFAEKTNDVFNLKRIFTNLAYNYKCLGQYELSISYLERSLLLVASDPDTIQKWEAIQPLTEVFHLISLSRTSILFQTEALRIAQIIGDVLNEQLSLMYLGTLYSSIEEYEDAKEFFQKAVEKAETFKSEKARKKALAFTNLRYANLNKLLADCETAIKLYNFATDYYENSEFQLHNYEAHKGKLLCYLQSKNDSSFQKELPVILEIFNKYRKEILEEKNRHSFFDNEQSIYDIAVDYEFSKANFTDAFDYAEESRSRSLLDLQNSAIQVSTNEMQPQINFSENLSNPLKLAQIQNEMPENTQLLAYSVSPEKILIWLITKNSVNTATAEISSEILQEKISDYLKLVSSNVEPIEQLKLSRELHQVLISPIKDRLNINKQIFIIPDKILFRLSFATLYEERYLIEDYKISYSPSANVFLNCSKKAKELSMKTSETLLSIGNPTFNKAEYENILQSLPSAKNEAEEIAENYENPLVFTQESATKEKVKENLKNADIFHFAGHYVVDEKTPMLSSLVLAGEKKEESRFANYEIIGERLSNTRLIVLSACETGVEKYYKGEGMIGASRTFLAMNIPLVVASQWAVDSTATKELMVRFHQLRQTKQLSTAEALRQSQIEMLKGERFRQPYYWAAFISLGGYTQF